MTIQLGYDSKTLNVLVDDDGLDPFISKPEKNENRSLGGKIETLTFFDLVVARLAIAVPLSTYYDLVGFWSYVSRGNSFSLAMDTGQVGNTTLDGAAASGQKDIPLTATTAFSQNEYCLIRQAAKNGQYEVVQVGSKDVNKVVAAANLQFTYASGDTFRHFRYYPSVKLLNEQFNPSFSGDYAFWNLEMIEAL